MEYFLNESLLPVALLPSPSPVSAQVISKHILPF